MIWFGHLGHLEHKSEDNWFRNIEVVGESKKKVHQNCMKVIMKIMKINGEENMHNLVFLSKKETSSGKLCDGHVRAVQVFMV